jgi:hypothetical protein
MTRRLSKDEVDSIRRRAESTAPYAYEAAPRDRKALLQHVDALDKELVRLKTQGQQGALFVLVGQAER